MLQLILLKDGYEIRLAENGQEALNSVQDSLPDLILMDVVMPVMDGFDATKAIREYLGDIHIPILFLTGLSDDDTLTKCLTVGGDDFLYKPITHQVLKAKITAHRRIRDLTQQLNNKNQELMAAQKKTAREQVIAKDLFERVMGASLKQCENTTCYMSSASTFNGDILLTAKGPSGSLYVLLADFTGHGLPAAIGTLPVSQMFFELVQNSVAVTDMSRKINKTLESFLPDEMFAAATILELNKLGTRATVWAGGLPDAYICDQNGKLKEKIRSSNLALGISKDEDFNANIQTINFDQGDRIILYTDGLVEAKNLAGERFGSKRLDQIFELEQFDVFDQIIVQSNQFQSGTEQLDDISIIEICCQPFSEEPTQKPQLHANDKLPWSLSMELDAHTLKGRAPVMLLTDMICISPGLCRFKDALHTVLTELYSNALEHGVLGISSELKNSQDGYLKYYEERQDKLMALTDGYVRFQVDYRFEKHKGVINISVSDSGAGFDFTEKRTAKKSDESGRGLTLISQLMDELNYSGKGNQVEVRLHIH